MTQSKPTTISNCQFTALQIDPQASETIRMIAEGLLENAKGLGKLANVLSASNINIEALLRIDGSQPKAKAKRK